MAEYHYNIVLQTQLGDKKGKLTLWLEPPHLSGSCTLLGYTEPCDGQIDPQGNCTLHGKLKTFMSEIAYTGDGHADSSKVDFRLYGRDSLFRMIGTAI